MAGPALALGEKSTAVCPSEALERLREAPLPLNLHTHSHLPLALGFSCVVSFRKEMEVLFLTVNCNFNCLLRVSSWRGSSSEVINPDPR